MSFFILQREAPLLESTQISELADYTGRIDDATDTSSDEDMLSDGGIQYEDVEPMDELAAVTEESDTTVIVCNIDNV